MARADRLDRLDRRREGLEEDYRTALIAALKITAAGSWGLFDHRQDRHDRARAAPVVAELEGLAEEIAELREQLMLDEPFALHRQFLAARGPVRAQAVGEPKQARAWLERLEAETEQT
ncbi:hypothetical protein AQZ52_07480 [Novosphingobium fuchskuhlense]|uniref:Uncharacterized protein n=1 Tax=Novosphingobium fuchskuhlense TaxID=1117702 RepID=A0A117UY69_9SPHN|nr:hypothetical protein [Novosphingobium fuchskuhlense]KUR73028.1 hypothetical protein AQZ52_07480 [Novosphingobium fuchskuhlense]